YPVKIDPGQFEQVLLNLVLNACDAMSDGGVCTLATGNFGLPASAIPPQAKMRPGNFVRLAVTDTGCGIDEATLSRIFEPFFTTKDIGKGTGLGLATVHSIVDQCGGAIHVQSQLGVGTTFSIYLPSAQEDAEAERTEAISTDLPRGTETVLLVEDDETIRR